MDGATRHVCQKMTLSNPPLWVGDQRPPTYDTVKHTSLFMQLSNDPSTTIGEMTNRSTPHF